MSLNRNTAVASDSQIDKKSQLLVRINGTMPDLTTIGDEEKSERASEVKRMDIATPTNLVLYL